MSKLSTAEQFKKELENLETAVAEKISFTVQTTSDANSLTLIVTFDSGLGTHPDLTLVVPTELAGNVSMTVTKSTAGVPSNEQFRFKYGDKVSPAVKVGAKVEEVKINKNKNLFVFYTLTLLCRYKKALRNFSQ